MKIMARIFRFMILSIIAWLLFLGGPLVSISIINAADPVGWRDLGLYGGQINAITIDPVDPNTMFAGSWYGDGLFKSTDGGATWYSVEGFRNKLVHSIAFDPWNHLTIWVGTFHYIYRSEDGGVTWVVFDPAFGLGYDLSYVCLAIDPVYRNVIYVGTSGENGSNDSGFILWSTNGGDTWEEASSGFDHRVVDIALNHQDSYEMWAVTGPAEALGGSIYKSLDGGLTWSVVSTGHDEGWFDEVAISPHDPNTILIGGEKGLYITKDGGSSWKRWYVEEYSCRALAFDSQDPDIMYANWGYKFSKSTDGGESWPFHSISPLSFFSLTAHPRNSQILYGGDINLGIYKSSDKGENWQAINQGVRANHVFGSAISARGKILAASKSGLYVKNQEGGWEMRSPKQIYSVAFNPADENTIFAGFAWQLGKSTDSGRSWTYVDISSRTDPHTITSIDIYRQNPQILYMSVDYRCGCHGEVYQSVDGGETITRIGYASVPVNVVKASPNNPQVIYAGTGMFYTPIQSGGIYKTIDGGQNWEELLSGVVVNTLAFDPENPDIIYAGCGTSGGSYSGLYKSVNGGITWVEKVFGLPEDATIVDIEVDADNSNIVYAATERDGIFISYDGGNYWTLFGLSDYDLFDILVSAAAPTTSKIKRVRENDLLPSSKLYTGSGSGMLEFTGSGVGIITGMVTESKTNLALTGATLSTDTGGVALSLDGHYIMVLPAGICLVKAKAEGYLGKARRNVAVTAGGEATVNLTLTPMPTTFSIKKFETDSTGPVPVGTQVTFSAEAEASGSTTLYYRFYVASGYGTSNYGNWQMIRDYSQTNTCTWTPQAEGNYVVVAWVTDDTTSGKFHQVGIAVSTSQASSSPVQITELESDISYPVNTGGQISLTADATGGSGTIQYQFWVTDGTN